jgi:hypothetical protein
MHFPTTSRQNCYAPKSTRLNTAGLQEEKENESEKTTPELHPQFWVQPKNPPFRKNKTNRKF